MEYRTQDAVTTSLLLFFDTLGAWQHPSPIHFHGMAKSNVNTLPNISQKKAKNNDKRANDDRTIPSNEYTPQYS